MNSHLMLLSSDRFARSGVRRCGSVTSPAPSPAVTHICHWCRRCIYYFAVTRILRSCLSIMTLTRRTPGANYTNTATMMPTPLVSRACSNVRLSIEQHGHSRRQSQAGAERAAISVISTRSRSKCWHSKLNTSRNALLRNSIAIRVSVYNLVVPSLRKVSRSPRSMG